MNTANPCGTRSYNVTIRHLDVLLPHSVVRPWSRRAIRISYIHATVGDRSTTAYNTKTNRVHEISPRSPCAFLDNGDGSLEVAGQHNNFCIFNITVILSWSALISWFLCNMPVHISLVTIFHLLLQRGYSFLQSTCLPLLYDTLLMRYDFDIEWQQ